MSNEVLDAENWKCEAQSVIKDIKNHVKVVVISECLNSTNQTIFLNLTTLEGKDYCVELSGRGFRVVGRSFDKTDIGESRYFETPYSLLGSISLLFHNSFGNQLLRRLNELKAKELKEES